MSTPHARKKIKRNKERQLYNKVCKSVCVCVCVWVGVGVCVGGCGYVCVCVSARGQVLHDDLLVPGANHNKVRAADHRQRAPRPSSRPSRLRQSPGVRQRLHQGRRRRRRRRRPILRPRVPRRTGRATGGRLAPWSVWRADFWWLTAVARRKCRRRRRLAGGKVCVAVARTGRVRVVPEAFRVGFMAGSFADAT